jgi:single-stranded-DNA-specific exonuclease
MAEAVVRRWAKREVDDRIAIALAEALSLHPTTARLLVARGFAEPSAAARYLAPQLSHLPDPSTMKHVDRAADRIIRAIDEKQKITLYGDYDVDGVTSSALLAYFLRLHGAEPNIYIPKRLIEGYGLNREAVEKLAGAGTQVLITLDCGITAADEIARANQFGIETIVVDHHRCPPALPPAFATLNPHQDDCAYPDKVLAAVGVTFNLVIAIRRSMRERGAYAGKEEPNLRKMLDLVALGTIADMVPLTGVNRVLVHFGVGELKRAVRPGVRALMDVAGVNARRCQSADVGFRLGPRINAAGRLDDASVGVRLLLTEDMREARQLAEALDHANAQRQRIEAEVFRAAVAIVDPMKQLPDALVLADEEWHPGVVGIVATKLVERYDRPTVLIGEGGRGSARTARGIHLYNMLADVSEHLTKFGGHRAAAGLRIARERIEPFRADLCARIAKEIASGLTEESILHYDDDLEPESVDLSFYAELARLEPFGNGNPEPLFRIANVRVRGTRVVGGQHLKLRLVEGRLGGLKAIAFRKGELLDALYPGRAIDLTCHLDLSEFQGFESLELRIRDLRLLEDVVPLDVAGRSLEQSAGEPPHPGAGAQGAWG